MQKGTTRSVCYRGLHPMTKENTYIVPKTGQRYCRICRAETRRYYWSGEARPERGGTNFIDVLSTLVPRSIAAYFVAECLLRDLAPQNVVVDLIRDFGKNNSRKVTIEDRGIITSHKHAKHHKSNNF